MTSKGMRLAYLAGGALALVAIVLYSAGFFTTGKVAPGRDQAPSAAAGPSAQAELGRIPEYHEAPGTIRPRSEATVQSQAPGRVLAVNFQTGQTVTAGQVLVVLEDKQTRARLEQARQAAAAAGANLERARAEYGRVQGFIQDQAATPQDLERVRAGFLAAQAGQGQAMKAVEEAQVALGWARVVAPEDGLVVKRLIEPGDLAMPGRPLLVMQTSGGLRLEAVVAEGVVDRLTLGDELAVEVPALDKTLRGRVEEIAPAADPQTRSFLVKAALPALPGLRAGMYGRLLVELGSRPAVLMPAAALRRVGQLEVVEVQTPEGWRRVLVRAGRRVGDQVEVLSGLKGGETLAIKATDGAAGDES